MVKLILHGFEGSPPVRAVLLTLNALGLDYEFKEVNLLGGESHIRELKRMNPQGTVPVLEDDGKYLSDSHAIITYLVKKYAKDDALYPKDFYQNAIVDQRLHFDSGVLFPSLRNITLPIFLRKETSIPQVKIDAIYDGLNLLEAFLQNDYLAGSSLTVADFSAVSTVVTLDKLAPIDPAKTPKVVAWINRLSELPYYEKANGRGVVFFDKMFKAVLGTN